jgi:hypothetical protein
MKKNHPKSRLPLCGFLLVVLFAVVAAAAEKTYQKGVLRDVSMEDISFPLEYEKITMPVPLGTMYRFQIEKDDLTYTSACIAKKKRSYASEWIVNDPIEFRIDKAKVFLKRPSGKELRLSLLRKTRNDSAAGSNSASTADPKKAKQAHQTIPECH